MRSRTMEAWMNDCGCTATATPQDPSHVQCHSCGHELTPGAKIPSRCPRCGGSSWERFESPTDVLIEPDRRREVTFALRCPATQAYLSGTFGGESTRMFEMSPDGADAWRITLHLPPGTYRYRFYVDDGRLLLYWPINGRDADGFDQTVVVPELESASVNGGGRADYLVPTPRRKPGRPPRTPTMSAQELYR